MAHLHFEGDLVGVRPRQLEFIREVLEKRGFKGSKVVIEPVGNAGENYMANVKRIVVHDEGKTFQMVAKLAPDGTNRGVMSVDTIFHNEHFMYTVVFPKFDEKQKSAGIPENERFRFAKCYGTLMEVPNEVILLEDLKESNFSIMNRFLPLKNECVKMVLKKFAIYHALSYVMRYKDPETYAVYQKELTPADNDWEEKAQQFFNHLEAHTIKITDGRYQNMIKGVISGSPKSETKIRKFAKESKYAVIQMGDAWTSNIMFRFENDVPVECVLVDYQMVKENSPVFDIMYMIFNSTTHQQRLQHFYEYIDYYHNELDKALNSFGLKANFVYPRDRLDADMKIYGKYVLSLSIVVSNIISKQTEEAEDLKEAFKTLDIDSNPDEILKALMSRGSGSDSEEIFKVKVEGLVDSFCEFGLV